MLDEEEKEQPLFSRRIGSSRYIIDANCIREGQADPDLEQLQVWKDNGVIRLDISDVAATEAARGSAERTAKTMNRIRVGTLFSRSHEMFPVVESILFRRGADTQNKVNDVLIVLNAKVNGYTLITNDGDIFKKAKQLNDEIGLRVLRPKQAVAEIRPKIQSHDELLKRTCAREGITPPDWLGKD